MVPSVGHPGPHPSAGRRLLRLLHLRRGRHRILHARLDHLHRAKGKRLRVLREVLHPQQEQTVQVPVHVCRSAHQQRLLHP